MRPDFALFVGYGHSGFGVKDLFCEGHLHLLLLRLLLFHLNFLFRLYQVIGIADL